jgi:hypothetical protein
VTIRAPLVSISVRVKPSIMAFLPKPSLFSVSDAPDSSHVIALRSSHRRWR